MSYLGLFAHLSVACLACQACQGRSTGHAGTAGIAWKCRPTAEAGRRSAHRSWRREKRGACSTQQSSAHTLRHDSTSKRCEGVRDWATSPVVHTCNTKLCENCGLLSTVIYCFQLHAQQCISVSVCDWTKCTSMSCASILQRNCQPILLWIMIDLNTKRYSIQS